MRNEKYACFGCRKTYTRQHSQCPHCGGELRYMGKYFKPPKRDKDKEWEAAELLINAGAIYQWRDGERRPRHPRDVPAYLAQEYVQTWIRFWRSPETLDSST